ncbi:MAG: hypothetical protein WBD05_07185 [Phycisphaerae bacterium]
MARWQRDPRVRRRLAILLAAVEVMVVSINFFCIFSAYFRRLCISVAPSWPETNTEGFLVLAVAVLFLLLAVFEAIMYVKGRPWARLAFIGENALLVVLGLVWFLVRMVGPIAPGLLVVVCGLLVPIGTLFPLLWPLLTFRPVTAAGGETPRV